jgi:hypothetical protein
MIDRLFAMWQALYPNSYVEPQSQLASNFWYSAGNVLDVDTRKSVEEGQIQGNLSHMPR